jgi:hypothetical protein
MGEHFATPARETLPEPLHVFTHADAQAREFIAERGEHLLAWVQHAIAMARLPGGNDDEMVHAIRVAGLEFRALRETALDLLERRRLGS